MAFKARRIPLCDIPKDLIDDYFIAKKRALDVILSHVSMSTKGKMHLKFTKKDRRRLRDELLSDWRFSAHYVDSAINSMIGLVKGWITRCNRGLASERPRITKKTVYIKSSLFHYRDGILKISVEPNKRYLEINLDKYPWLLKVFDKIGGLILKEEGELIICFKKDVELKADQWSAIDINLTNITMIVVDDDVAVKRYDIRELQRIHRVYEEKRERIQKLAVRKPKTAKKLFNKYRRRERNRVNDLLHKLTSKIANELVERRSGAVLEDLKGIKEDVLNGSKDMNRRLSKWDVRNFQQMLEYKLLWHGLPTEYVNPKNTSKTCPLCSGRLTPYEDRLMGCDECGITADRDVVAALNIYKRVCELPRDLIETLLVTEPIVETIVKKIGKLRRLMTAE